MSSYAVSDSVPVLGGPSRCVAFAAKAHAQWGEGPVREALGTDPRLSALLRCPAGHPPTRLREAGSSTASYLQAPPMSGAWLFAGWGFPCSSICYTVVDTCWCCCRLSSLQCAFAFVLFLILELRGQWLIFFVTRSLSVMGMRKRPMGSCVSTKSVLRAFLCESEE